MTQSDDKKIMKDLHNMRSQDEMPFGFPGLCDWIKGFYADGVIEKSELKKMQNMRSDILLDYQVAQDLMSKMDKKSPQYHAAERLVNHLRQCYWLIDNATDKGAVYNTLTPEQKARRSARETNKETLNLSIGATEATLLAGLTTTKARIEAERVFHDMAMKTTNIIRKAQLQEKVVAAINEIQKREMNAIQLNRVLGLERV